MISDQNNAEWVSVTFEQQSADTDWVKWQGEIITVPEDLGYSSVDSTASSLYFDGWNDYSGDTLFVEQSGSFQQEVMPAGSLSVAVSGASYDSVSFSVGGQDTTSVGIAFNNDGTKMFILGEDTNSVYQYTLTTEFDLSTASYDSVSLSVGGQDTLPYGIAFNNDGTKMFILGYANKSVFQYSLATAFDLSTASYDSVSFSVGGIDAQPLGIAFNNDGTKMFILEYTNNSVFQYSLATAFDLSTASDDSVSFSVAGQVSTPYGIAFNSDGTKMFILGGSNDSIYQYSLTTGFDLSTASYDSVSFSVGGIDAQPLTIAFNNDGTKMFMVGISNDSVYQYSTNFSSTYAVSLASTPSIVTSIPSVSQHVCLATTDATAFVTDKEFPVVSATTTSITLGYDNDADSVVAVNDSVTLKTVNPNTDISTTTYDSVSFSVATQDATPVGIAFNNDGTKMFIVGYSNDSVFQYSLTTAFDLSTASYDSVSFSVAGQDTEPFGMAFNDDGTKMYMAGITNKSVFQYSLTTAFDLSTASYDSVSFSVAGQDTQPYGIAFNDDGTKMYILGVDNDSVFQYSLTTGFDLSTASYDSVSFSVGTQDTKPRSIAFNNTGTKMFMMGNSTDTVYQYTLITAFDLSTASYDSVSFSVAGQDVGPYGIAFDNTDIKMFMAGIVNDSIFQYTTDAYFSTAATVTDAVVTTGQTQLSFAAQPAAPTSAVLPSWATTYTPVSYTESNGNIVQRSDGILTDNGKRFAKFKLVGDTGQEVSNAKINLWKEV